MIYPDVVNIAGNACSPILKAVSVPVGQFSRGYYDLYEYKWNNDRAMSPHVRAFVIVACFFHLSFEQLHFVDLILCQSLPDKIGE